MILATKWVALLWVVALTACNGCAIRPLGVSCKSISVGSVTSRSLAHGTDRELALAESRGAQESRVVCRVIYSADDIEAELSQED